MGKVKAQDFQPEKEKTEKSTASVEISEENISWLEKLIAVFRKETKKKYQGGV